MKSRGAILVLAILLVPLFASAKSPKLAGFERDKGKSITVSEPLGWPASITASSHVKGTVTSLPGMTVVRLLGYEPWWKIWGDLSATTTVTISGLPKNSTLHIYTRGYREHKEINSDARGAVTLDFDSDSGAQFIIKSNPSTKHIALDPLLGPPGGDCSEIGTWTAITRTCKLNQDVFETISIEDAGITLDGNNFSVRGADSGDGIYTDESDVRITNIEVHRFDRGIVYSDSLFTLASGGQIDGTTLADNILNIMDEGVSDLKITDNDIVVAGTGISLVDQFDSFPTDGIVIVRNSFKQNTNNDLFNSGTSFVLNTATDRGNWWAKNTNCTQDPANPDHCTNMYNEGDGTDNAPWACENAWRSNVNCPTTPLPNENGIWGEVTSFSTGTTTYYKDSPLTIPVKVLPNGWVLKVLGKQTEKWEVQDVTDDSTGWVKSSDMSSDSSLDQERGERAEVTKTDKAARVEVIDEAISHFYNNNSVSESLYSSNSLGRMGVRSNISQLKSLGFVKALIYATASWESGGKDFNNELVTYDYGHGIKQITFQAWFNEPLNYQMNTWDNRGLASNIIISGCESVKSDNYKDCYVNTQTQNKLLKPYKQFQDNQANPTYKMYSNSSQSIYANVKDGMVLLAGAMTRANRNIGNPGINWASGFSFPYTISDNEMKQMSSLRDYNAGPGSRCTPVLNPYNQYYLKNVGLKLSTINSIFPELNYTDTDHFVEKLSFASTEQDRIEACSPVYVQVLDSANRLVGYNGTAVVHQIPRVTYDYNEYKVAHVLLPNDDYSYRALGYETGTYSLYIDRFSEEKGDASFIATEIPTSRGEIHEYNPDWKALATGKRGMLVKVDNDGDGVFDYEFVVGSALTSDKFMKFSKENTGKVLVCHIPPGNPQNVRTISISNSALETHLNHGDKEGECLSATKSKNRKK
ncbi:MAG TPA: hypothetical protein VJB98_02395 [Candidatus Paceibacterota bacterium]